MTDADLLAWLDAHGYADRQRVVDAIEGVAWAEERIAARHSTCLRVMEDRDSLDACNAYLRGEIERLRGRHGDDPT